MLESRFRKFIFDYLSACTLSRSEYKETYTMLRTKPANHDAGSFETRPPARGASAEPSPRDECTVPRVWLFRVREVLARGDVRREPQDVYPHVARRFGIRGEPEQVPGGVPDVKPEPFSATTHGRRRHSHDRL